MVSSKSDIKTETQTGQGVVFIEALYQANRLVGGDGTGQVVIEETADPGDTVRSVLKRVSGRFPQLKEALWDRGTAELSEHLQITVNGTFLGLRYKLDSEVQLGDKISFANATCGGI